MFRIYGGPVAKTKGVVFLQHGLFASADSWVINKEKSLAIHLAQSGFDVWLGNARGSKHSRKNRNLDEYWGKYWDFTIDDLALDLIENINFILRVTGYQKLGFVGHGHGATEMLMCLSNSSQCI